MNKEKGIWLIVCYQIILQIINDWLLFASFQTTAKRGHKTTTGLHI